MNITKDTPHSHAQRPTGVCEDVSLVILVPVKDHGSGLVFVFCSCKLLGRGGMWELWSLHLVFSSDWVT